MPRSLPVNPSVRFLHLEAKDIVAAHKKGDLSCCATLRYHFRFSRADDGEIMKAHVTLQEAQHALSLDYGFKSWTDLTGQASALSGADLPPGDGVSVERKRVEEGGMTNEAQRREAEKLTAVGEMAGGIAHDFNNILDTIVGYTERARNSTAEGTPTHGYLSDALTATDQAKALADRILSFAKARHSGDPWQ